VTQQNAFVHPSVNRNYLDCLFSCCSHQKPLVLYLARQSVSMVVFAEAAASQAEMANSSALLYAVKNNTLGVGFSGSAFLIL